RFGFSVLSGTCGCPTTRAGSVLSGTCAQTLTAPSMTTQRESDKSFSFIGISGGRTRTALLMRIADQCFSDSRASSATSTGSCDGPHKKAALLLCYTDACLRNLPLPNC